MIFSQYQIRLTISFQFKFFPILNKIELPHEASKANNNRVKSTYFPIFQSNINSGRQNLITIYVES